MEGGDSLELVDVKDIRQNTVILKNGGLIQVVMVSGTNFSLKPPEEQNTITAAYQNFLNSLGFPIQIIVHSRKVNIKKYLGSLQKREDEESAPLLQSQIDEYRKFVEEFVKENPIMTKTFFVAIPYYPINVPKASMFKLPFLGKAAPVPASGNQKVADEDFEKGLMQLKQRLLHVSQGIEAIGLQAKQLTTEEIIELLYNFYNPETVEKEEIVLPDAGR